MSRPPLLLVTGASGFVGSALCRSLLQQGMRVRGVTRRPAFLPTGAEAADTGELGPDTDWRTAVEGVTAIVHLAARVHVMRETASDPDAEFRRVNTAGTRTLARQAAAAGVKRLVYVSTIKVNGERTLERPFRADDTAAPLDAYARSKWEAEQELHDIAAKTGLEVTVVRPPLVYGPEVGGNFLRLMKLIRAGIPLPLASVDNRRSLVYQGNLVDALARCARHEAAAGRTFLVSDGEDLSTARLMRELAQRMGKPARLWPFPAPLLRTAAMLLGKGDEIDRLLDSLQVDDSAIRTELGWTPPFDLATGLSETVRWFEDARSSAGHNAPSR